jgi:hydroxymethylpyrimidine kinase/phosphomethylpyrimidine kinase
MAGLKMCYIKKNFLMKSLLTIAGHDLSHGAGITKDLEMFSSLGFHAITVPTSFVVQGPKGVTGIHPVPRSVFSAMLARVDADFSVSGIKVGVVAHEGHAEKVAAFAATRRGVPFVLDPVIASKNGKALTTEEGVRALVEKVLPLVTCITPNLDEAERLVEMPVRDVKGMERAAGRIMEMGPKAVVLKGGHLEGEIVDVLYDGRKATTYRRKRVEKVVHGTGCMFSSSLLAFLALGHPLKEAFLQTEELMGTLFDESRQVGRGGYWYAFPALLMARTGSRIQ